jgi:hypothetical protein
MPEIPIINPEKKDLTDDNARKFTLDTLDVQFLEDHEAKSFLLTTDWLEKTESSETKIARKEYPDGKVQILLIQKFRDGDKTTVPPKKQLTEEESAELLKETPSIEHVVKTRHEFAYKQVDPASPLGYIEFPMKYDEFADSTLRILEVDAEDDALRESFDKNTFPVPIREVTGDMRYYGYRVAQMV